MILLLSKVPYVEMRFVAAMAGALLSPLVFLIMRELGHQKDVSFLAASMIFLGLILK